MAKLSKTTKTVIIAAAVLLVLGAVLLVLVMTSPKDSGSSGDASAVSGEAGTSESSAAADDGSSASSGADEKVVINSCEQENVLKLEVSNQTGSFSFDRASREVSSTDDDGNVSTATQYYWTSPELDGISRNDSTIGAFVRSMAGLSASSMVEEGASDLEKYGLEEPLSTVKVTFDDGTSNEICFGIRNPAASNYVYCCVKGSSDVMEVSYYSTGSAFYDIKDFVSLVLTDAYDSNNPQELEYLTIERKDLSEPVEIEYMFDVAAEAEDEDSVVTTFNSHRITSPITAELDTTSGQTICYGLYALSAASCQYIDPTDEELAATGLDDPYCRVSFKYGGKARVLLLGNEIRESSDDSDDGSLSSVTGYYAMFEGDRLIYAISTSNAPWYTFSVQDIMSRRPISPYIYTVDKLTVSTPDGEYAFTIEGDADNHTFRYNGEALDDTRFKSFYQHLITSMGEERKYKPLPKYPSTSRDLSLVCDDEVTSDEIIDIIRKNAKHLESVSIFDMYKGEQVPEGKKSLSYKLVLRKDGSMTDEEADAVVAKVLKALAEKNITLRA